VPNDNENYETVVELLERIAVALEKTVDILQDWSRALEPVIVTQELKKDDSYEHAKVYCQ